MKTLEDRKKALCDSLKSDGLKYYANLLYADGSNPQSEENSQTRMKDHISHFILRLVYCHNPEQSKWFVNQEVEFFKLRFSSLDKKGVEHLLSINNLDCTLVRCIVMYNVFDKVVWDVQTNYFLNVHLQISQDEKLELKEELSSSSGKVMNIDISDIYKVRFEKVVDLVRGRRIYLKAGIAYIAHMDIISVFISHFKEILLAGLQVSLCTIKEYLGS